MPYEYYAENHDWDMTLRAAWNLLMVGQMAKNHDEIPFSSYTGSMLLSFCSIESFLTSTAFLMSREERYLNFDYKQYSKFTRFEDKLKYTCNALGITVDKSKGLFQKIGRMRIWRNALVHASPYSIEVTKIVNTQDSKDLHIPYRNKEYTKSVNLHEAQKFYSTAYDFIELIKNTSGLNPRALCSYKGLE